MTITKGLILSKRYEILSVAGMGGMAEVYKARDLSTGEIVAVKVLKQEFNNDSEFVRRFDLEARAAASLSHPNIVNVYGVGEDRGIRFIVQEYVEGRSLKEVLETEGKMDWRIAVPISIQIALALEHAHSQSIIHRDIKPANILMTDDGVCKVTDFGIARAANSNTVTMTGGNALGSVHYFSPEQARGGIVDYRTDLYSLGIVMYELLTGEVPFDGESSVAVAIKQLQEQPVPPSELEPSIPKGLEDIVLRCMQKNPDNRYDNARDLITDLDNFLVNPNGRYGKISSPQPENRVVAPEENLVKPNNKQSTLNQVVDLEQSINSKRKSRNRDTIITTVVVILAFVLIGFGVWFFSKGLFKDLNKDKDKTDSYVMEDFIGQDYQAVSDYLTEKGINHIRVESSDENYAEGKIIAQSIPKGMEINPSGTFVKGSELVLTVSTGSEFVVIPDVVGKNVEDAINLIQSESKLTVMTSEVFSTEVEAGKVISVSPKAGSKVNRNERVTLTVSKGLNKGPVPDVVGQPVYGDNGAVDRLNKQGFRTEVQIPAYLRGQENSLYVVKMSPNPGTANYTEAIILLAGTYEDANPTTAPSTTATSSTASETEASSPAETEEPAPTEPASEPDESTDTPEASTPGN